MGTGVSGAPTLARHFQYDEVSLIKVQAGKWASKFLIKYLEGQRTHYSQVSDYIYSFFFF